MHRTLYAMLSLAGAAAKFEYEVMLPMRDGVKLHTMINMPLFTNLSSNATYPAVIDRSPYGQDHLELIADVYSVAGHAAVRQDVRGTEKSEGYFSMWHTSAQDGYDTISYLIQQNWSDGTVRTVGASADGLETVFMMSDPHPALKAQFLIFCGSTGYEYFFVNGAYRQNLIEKWLEGTVPNNSSALIAEAKSHEAPGPWWDLVNGSMWESNVHWPAVHFGGWYDIFLIGQLVTFSAFQHTASSGATGLQSIVIDPLGHCQKAAHFFPEYTIDGRTALAVLQSFDLFTNKTFIPNNESLPEGSKAVTFYVIGAINETKAPGHYWTTLDDFPEYVSQPWFLGPGGSLSLSAPTVVGSASLIHNPANPIPTNGGNNLFEICGPIDQSALEAAHATTGDMLLFTSGVLKEALPVTGPLFATLFVSSNCTDTDVTIKLVDVHPSGFMALVQDSIIRMRRRSNDITNISQPMVPGEIYEARIMMWNTSWIFNAGHQLRIEVAGSNYPRFSVNPNNDLTLLENGTAYIAQNTFYWGPGFPSAITLPSVTMKQLPKFNLLEYAHTQLAQRIRTVYSRNSDRIASEISALEASATHAFSAYEADRYKRLVDARSVAAKLSSESIDETVASVRKRFTTFGQQSS